MDIDWPVRDEESPADQDEPAPWSSPRPPTSLARPRRSCRRPALSRVGRWSRAHTEPLCACKALAR